MATKPEFLVAKDEIKPSREFNKSLSYQNFELLLLCVSIKLVGDEEQYCSKVNWQSLKPRDSTLDSFEYRV